MTALCSKLVEKVARAICLAENVDPDGIGYAMTAETLSRLPQSYPLWQYRIPIALAVIDACHAEEMLETLRLLSDRHEGYGHGMGPCVCPAHERARALLAKMDDRA